MFGGATLVFALTLAACSVNETSIESEQSVTLGPSATVSNVTDAAAGLGPRLAAIQTAIGRWQRASSLAAARSAAEEARNLVVGASGPYYGDSDRNGVIGGANTRGLLPGLRGEDAVAQPENGYCVVRDILGGSWADPPKRWAILDAAIKTWAPSRNTFPNLPSHPQRVVGWASLALSTDSLKTAKEYGGHARLHIDVSSRAISQCNEGRLKMSLLSDP